MNLTAVRKIPAPSAKVIRAAIALGAVLLTAWAQWLAPAPSLGDEWLRDRFVRIRATDAPEPRILVVDIDEASTNSLGPWPWPRERVAELVEKLLTTYAARGVALDIVMPDPGPGTGDGDRRLALLAQHAPLVLATAFDYHTVRGEPVLGGALSAGGKRPPGANPLAATGYVGNHAGLAGAARHVGNIGFVPDADGVLRRIPMYTSYRGQVYPALTLALLGCCSGGAAPPLPAANMVRIPFVRDWSAYDVVSAADIIDQSLDAASTSGRLVLVGSSSLGQGDRVTTPLAAQRPGLGVHATMLSTLLDWQEGKAPIPLPGALIALAYAAATAGLAMFALPRISAIGSVAVLSLLSLAWLPIAFVLTAHDPSFVSTSPLASAFFLLAVAIPFQWQLTQQRSRSLLSTLRQYVAREVVDEMLRSDLQDPLEPARRDVTTLIADMEGYTTHVESLGIEDASTLTRDFLSCLTGPVLAHRGTLDKYTGDGLVAFWGAPLPIDDHADLALDAAREIVQAVERMSAQRVAAGLMPLRVRIGIESGAAMAGDFGTSFRSIYTAVGDSVNTASRLEQAAREFPHGMVIGAGTVARATRHDFELLGERRLRGKELPTTLYTLAGRTPKTAGTPHADADMAGADR